MAVSPTPAQDVATGLGEAQQGDTDSGRTSAWIRKVPERDGRGGGGGLTPERAISDGGHSWSSREQEAGPAAEVLLLRGAGRGWGQVAPAAPRPVLARLGDGRVRFQREAREFAEKRSRVQPSATEHESRGSQCRGWRALEMRAAESQPRRGAVRGALGRRIRDGGGTGARPPVVTAEVRPGWAETVLTGSPLRPEPPPGAGRLEAPGGPGDRVDLRPAGWAESPTRPRPRLPQGRPRVWRLLPG